MGGGAYRPGLSTSASADRAPAGETLPGRPFVIVAGPTASGKSALALAIAREFDGIVVNADSMQVYRELSILTARPGPAELATAPHRLYGVLPASERCSAGRWCDMARQAMEDAPMKLAIVTGGTGLYLRALSSGLSPIPDIPPAVMREGVARLVRVGAAALHEELVERDPETAQRLNPGDSQRILRAWLVFEATGRTLADWQREPPTGDRTPNLTFMLMPERQSLYAAIDGRFRRMVEQGAVEEARAFLAHQDVAKRVLLEQFVIERKHGATGIAEDHIDALVDQCLDDNTCACQFLTRHKARSFAPARYAKIPRISAKTLGP